MVFKNILTKQYDEYNFLYKKVNREKPQLSKDLKKKLVLIAMFKARGIEINDMLQISLLPMKREFNYMWEVTALDYDMTTGINRYYINDDSLLDFFKTTEVKPKDVKSILDCFTDNKQGLLIGVLSKSFSFLLLFTIIQDGRHFITVYTEEMTYTFCIEDLKEDLWVYNMTMNFLFYINAFPECVIDGVPNGVKHNPKSKVISVSEKIVSHRTTEHGFVKPHFRSGYFRHLNSDYFVNCKGQVRFIASTMVKGKAKTVISKEEI